MRGIKSLIGLQFLADYSTKADLIIL